MSSPARTSSAPPPMSESEEDLPDPGWKEAWLKELERRRESAEAHPEIMLDWPTVKAGILRRLSNL